MKLSERIKVSDDWAGIYRDRAAQALDSGDAQKASIYTVRAARFADDADFMRIKLARRIKALGR